MINIGLLTWISNKLFNGTTGTTSISAEEFFNLSASLYVRNLAFYSAVNLIANSVSVCEFKTYLKGKEVKTKEYYLWNVEPNRNQNSSEFIHKMIDTLYSTNECLIIEVDGQLLIADHFSKIEYAIKDSIFEQVTVNGLVFQRSFFASEVMYLKLNNNDVRKLINGMYEDYSKLIQAAQLAYPKSKGQKGILKISSIAKGRPDHKEIIDQMLNDDFSKYFSAVNAVMPLYEGYEFSQDKEKTYGRETTRDIRAMIDDVYDITARAFCMPPALLRGEVANNSDVVNSYLTFLVDPLCDLIEEEANRKRNGYQNFVSKTYMTIDTKTIKHIDLLSVANAVDKLIASGAFCVNDIRKAVGDEVINEDWANQHWITKNYEKIDQTLKGMQGGET